MFESGYIQLAKWRKAPIRVHVLTPLGLWLFTGGFHLGAWLGFFFVILVHEMGHAFVVHRTGGVARSIDVLPIGGVCQWQGNVTPIGRACIAWGGVWAQMVLFALTYVLIAFVPPESTLAYEVSWSFTTRSAYLMALNLIPFPPLDGAEAWKLFPLLFTKFKNKRRKEKLKEQESQVLSQLREVKRQDESSEIPEEAKGVVIELFGKKKDDSKFKN
jgi:stage IV sporulation protein FB